MESFYSQFGLDFPHDCLLFISKLVNVIQESPKNDKFTFAGFTLMHQTYNSFLLGFIADLKKNNKLN